MTTLPPTPSNSCPECATPHPLHDLDQDTLVCSSCGLVLDMLKDSNLSRTNRDHNYYETGFLDSGLITEISNQRLDAKGTRLSISTQHHMKRLRNIDNKAIQYKTRTLRKAMIEIHRLCSQLQVGPDFTKLVAKTYSNALLKDLFHGKILNGTTAGLIYLLAQQTKYIITWNDIKKVANIAPKPLKRYIFFIKQQLDLKTKPIHPKDLIERFGVALHFTRTTINVAYELLSNVEGINLNSGRNPLGLTASALYLAGHITGEKRTQPEITAVTQITEMTIRSRNAELRQYVTPSFLLKHSPALQTSRRRQDV